MAQGDVKAEIIAVAAASWVAVQPPAGEHWLVKRIFSNQFIGTAPDIIPNVGLFLRAGGVSSYFGDIYTLSNSAKLYQQELNIGVNNATFFCLRNSATVSANIGYSAIQIK